MSIRWDTAHLDPVRDAAQLDVAQAEADARLNEDRDADGVNDETEAWLGTSALTDESGPDGLTDAGYTASVDRVQRARASEEVFQHFSDNEDEKTDATSVLQRGPRTFEGSPLAIRCFDLSGEDPEA